MDLYPPNEDVVVTVMEEEEEEDNGGGKADKWYGLCAFYFTHPSHRLTLIALCSGQLKGH